MKVPVQITFRNMKQSEVIEEWVRDEIAKLESFYSDVMGCRVAIEVPHRHHRKGSTYHIRIDLTMPGGEIVVKRQPSLSHRAAQAGETAIRKHLETTIPHKNLRLAINDAFKAAGRQLQDYARRRRGDVKTHAPLQVARVRKILSDKGYGFLATEDGREIYFHKNSVLSNGFSRLKTGAIVRFAEELGEKGLQASTVQIVSKGKIRAFPKGAAASAD
jgi:cold shock CspA family protein/ribosome-associated translation inhibitor RaiA